MDQFDCGTPYTLAPQPQPPRSEKFIKKGKIVQEGVPNQNPQKKAKTKIQSKKPKGAGKSESQKCL